MNYLLCVILSLLCCWGQSSVLPQLKESSGGEILQFRPETDPVQVSLYWESLCPDSIQFILTQLYPTYQAVPDIFTLDLVPYGKACSYSVPDVNGTYSFVCQHGSNECLGNKLLACALNLYTDENTQVEFVYCVENSTEPYNAGEQCATELGLDWDAIETCFDSNTANSYLFENGEITRSLNPTLNSVPWIVINGNHTQDTQVAAQYDLLNFLCDTYQGTKPAACSS